jgi:hypothetical protein
VPETCAYECDMALIIEQMGIPFIGCNSGC